MNKALLTLVTASSLAFASFAQAGHDYDSGHDYERGSSYQYADVLDAQPVFESVRVPYDRHVCYNERTYRHEPRRGNTAPVLLGAVLGGLVGNKIDGGDHRAAGTVIGALAGGAIANDATRHQRRPGRSYPVDRERCDVRTEYRYEEQLTGYDVTYRYKGEVYHTLTQSDPGDRLRVKVSVVPAEY
jgi:uncharacterized protein YcfJ